MHCKDRLPSLESGSKLVEAKSLSLERKKAGFSPAPSDLLNFIIVDGPSCDLLVTLKKAGRHVVLPLPVKDACLDSPVGILVGD